MSANVVGVVVGCAVFALGVALLVATRWALDRVKQRLKMLFGESIFQSAGPSSIRVAAVFSLLLGVLMVTLGVTGQFG